LEKIKEICRINSGATSVIFCITTITGEVAFIEAAEKYGVRVTSELIRSLTEVIGEGQLHYKADKSVPKAKEKPWMKYKKS